MSQNGDAQPRLRFVSRDLRRLLDAIERGEVTDSMIRVVELEEQVDDLRDQLRTARREVDVLREIRANP